MTPLKEAVDKGHHRIVDIFVKDCRMDTSQFDMVCVYMYSNVVRGVTVGGVVMTMLYMLSSVGRYASIVLVWY